MSDPFSEIHAESWFSRVKASIGGMIVGVVMIVASFPTLFVNEGRAVKTARSLAEGAAAVVHVPIAPVDPAREGKLVHFNGPAETRSALRDPIFGFEIPALQLARKVEMHQWKQTSRSTTRDKLGGGKETVTTYDYERDWFDTVQPSKDFKNPMGHQNPGSLPYPSLTLVASDATVGDFQVPQRLVAGLGGEWTPLTLDERALAGAPRGGGITGRPRVDGGGLYYGANPANPQVGDVRVRFTVMNLSDVSVVGRQSGRTVEPFRTRAGRDLEMARAGTFGPEAMFEGTMRSNTVTTWALRIVGYLLMAFGASMIFRPLAVVGSLVPVLGSIIGAGTGLLAFGLSGVVSLGVIAVAWLTYRPVLSIGLLLAGAALAAFVLKRGRARTPVAAGGDVPPPAGNPV